MLARAVSLGVKQVPSNEKGKLQNLVSGGSCKKVANTCLLVVFFVCLFPEATDNIVCK